MRIPGLGVTPYHIPALTNKGEPCAIIAIGPNHHDNWHCLIVHPDGQLQNLPWHSLTIRFNDNASTGDI